MCITSSAEQQLGLLHVEPSLGKVEALFEINFRGS